MREWVREERTREKRYQIGVSLCPSILRERCTGDCQPRVRMSLFDLWVAERICIFCGFVDIVGYGLWILWIVGYGLWVVRCGLWISNVNVGDRLILDNLQSEIRYFCDVIFGK